MVNSKKLFVMNIMSIAIMIYGIAMIPSLVMALRYQEEGVSYSMSIIVSLCIVLGFMGYRYFIVDLTDIKMSTCYTTTLMTWIVIIALSTLPYYYAGMNFSFVDSLFESVASWTTTGASAIPTAALPVGLKLWRASCNWMGGIGIILLTLSFLPTWQYVGQRLASTEIRGPGFLMSTTTFRQAYRRIIFIYLGITILHYLVLRLCGMGQLNSMLTALSNISTSGLQHLNNGVIIAYPTAIKVVITIFAFLASINVSVFVLVFVGKAKEVAKNSELKLYLLIIAIMTTMLSLSLITQNHGSKILATIGKTFMQVISFASTAGYIVEKCDHWNTLCICLISLMMFIGACAISTGGGLKVSRIVFAFKSLSLTIYKQIHPNSIRTVTYNKKSAKFENLTKSNMYIAVFLILYLIGGILITVDGTEAYTALSYSQAMLTNVGSPISQLADPGIVAHMTDYSKCVMCFLMLCGRLEIYPVMMIFSLSLWNSQDK